MPHFLALLIERPGTRYVLRNGRTGAILATDLEQAFDSARRRRGLLGRSRLAPAAAMILAPCAAVHTCFMRFPIDVVFVRRDGHVLKVCAEIKPWRAAGTRGAFAAIELAAGTAALAGTLPGDRLELSQY